MTLLPPLNGVLTPISPLPQAVISSYLEATKKEGKKTQCLLLALILFLLFFFLCSTAFTHDHCRVTRTPRGKKIKGAGTEWSALKKKSNYNMVKTIKRNLEQNCKQWQWQWHDYILQFYVLLAKSAVKLMQEFHNASTNLLPNLNLTLFQW